MPPESFRDFFLTTVGASASFIGLLFVALSIIMSRSDSRIEARERRLAESSFIALVNIFFISLEALLPNQNIGFIAIILGFAGIYRSVRMLVDREDSAWLTILWILSSFIIFAFQIYYSARLLANPTDIHSFNALAAIIIVLFALALLRAWDITGMRQR